MREILIAFALVLILTALLAAVIVAGSTRARRGKRVHCDHIGCVYAGHPYDVLVHMDQVHYHYTQ